MAKTKLEDVLIPEVWEQYVIERTAEVNTFGMSGIVGTDPDFNARAAGEGKLVDMPFWQDLNHTRQIISDTSAFTTNKIASSEDQARIHNDGQSWSTTMLAAKMAGSDGMEAIVALVGDYWGRIDEDILVASIKGVLAQFKIISGKPNLLDIAAESLGGTSTATVLNGTTYIDAKQKLGDQKKRLTAIAIHSQVEADLLKQQLIDFIPDADGRESLPVFQGLRVVVDDDLPSRNGTTSGTVYTSVLFGEGAFGSGKAPLTNPVQGGFGTEGVELARVPLNHDGILINRRRFILHPRGVKWTESNVDEAGAPNDGELADKDNWEKVWESKNIRIVGINHNLTSQIPASS